MRTTLKKQPSLIVVGLLFIATLLFNIGATLWSAPELATAPDGLVFDLVSQGDQRDVFIVTFGIREMYDAEEVTVTPEVAEIIGLSSESPERVGGIERIRIAPIDPMNIKIDPDAIIYKSRDENQFMFLQRHSSRLRVAMVNGIIIVTGYDS